jgi:hypothetical protein
MKIKIGITLIAVILAIVPTIECAAQNSRTTSITIRTDNTIITAILDDSATTREFLAELPCTLQMTRYGANIMGELLPCRKMVKKSPILKMVMLPIMRRDRLLRSSLPMRTSQTLVGLSAWEKLPAVYR